MQESTQPDKEEQLDMSHIKGPTTTSVMIGVWLLIVVFILLIVTLQLVHVSKINTLKFAAYSSIVISWIIYWWLLFDHLWIKVEGDEEVALQREIKGKYRPITAIGLTDPTKIPSDLRSIGGPGYNAKSFFEKKLGEPIKIATIQYTETIEVRDSTTGVYSVTYTLTGKTISGRYSLHALFTTPKNVEGSLKTTASAMVEALFASQEKGADIRKNLPKFNEELKKPLGADRIISKEEIRNGFFLINVEIAKIDDDDVTKELARVKGKTTKVLETQRQFMSDPDIAGVDPNVVFDTAKNLVGEKGGANISLTIFRGLPDGIHTIINGNGGNKEQGGK